MFPVRCLLSFGNHFADGCADVVRRVNFCAGFRLPPLLPETLGGAGDGVGVPRLRRQQKKEPRMVAKMRDADFGVQPLGEFVAFFRHGLQVALRRGPAGELRHREGVSGGENLLGVRPVQMGVLHFGARAHALVRVQKNDIASAQAPARVGEVFAPPDAAKGAGVESETGEVSAVPAFPLRLAHMQASALARLPQEFKEGRVALFPRLPSGAAQVSGVFSVLGVVVWREHPAHADAQPRAGQRAHQPVFAVVRQVAEVLIFHRADYSGFSRGLGNLESRRGGRYNANIMKTPRKQKTPARPSGMTLDEQLRSLVRAARDDRARALRVEKKNDERLARLEAEAIKDRRNNENHRRNSSRVLENSFAASLPRVMKAHKIHIKAEDVKVRARKGRKKREYDFVAPNTRLVLVGEVKTRFTRKDVTQLVGALAQFRRDYPEYAKLKLYGVVAGGVVEEDALADALEEGFFVLQMNGAEVHPATGKEYSAKAR